VTDPIEPTEQEGYGVIREQTMFVRNAIDVHLSELNMDTPEDNALKDKLRTNLLAIIDLGILRPLQTIEARAKELEGRYLALFDGARLFFERDLTSPLEEAYYALNTDNPSPEKLMTGKHPKPVGRDTEYVLCPTCGSDRPDLPGYVYWDYDDRMLDASQRASAPCPDPFHTPSSATPEKDDDLQA
jgi:hypothetical protein